MIKELLQLLFTRIIIFIIIEFNFSIDSIIFEGIKMNKTTNFNVKFNEALNIKYPKYKSVKEQTIHFINDYLVEYPNDTTIENYIHNLRYSNKSIDAFALKKICSILECDIDFFLSDKSPYNRDIKNASEETKLSEKAIYNITKLDDNKLILLDTLLEENKMDELLSIIYSINVEVYLKSNKKRDALTGMEAQADIQEEAIKFSYANNIISIVSKLYKYKKFNDYIIKTIRKNRKFNFAKPNKKFLKQVEKDIREGKYTFNELCEDEIKITET